MIFISPSMKNVFYIWINKVEGKVERISTSFLSLSARLKEEELYFIGKK